MKYILQTAGLSFAIVVLTAPLIINKLRELKFGQKILEDGPVWHSGKQNTPTIGGVIFILSITITLLSFIPHMSVSGDWRPLLMLALSLVFAGIGLVDDWTKIRKKQNKGITALQKILLQIAAAALFITLMRGMGYLENHIYIPFFGYTIAAPWLVYLPFSVFVIVGANNAVNFTDGIDGLCSGVTLIVSIFFSVAFLRVGQGGADMFSLALAGSLCGFFIFNRHPAKVFMGDTGSLFLGGAVCAMAFAYNMPLILITVGIIYILETLSVIIQVTYFKATHGKRFFKMAPFHHHLEMSGWSEWKIVIVFCTITAVMCLISCFA